MSKATTLSIWLTQGEEPELYRTEFTHPRLQQMRYCVRGKTSGGIPGAGTFQWTSAVRALTCLTILHAAQTKDPTI
ncbi:MAG: hypothetical protein PHC51_13325, partial [bacterium]|nr:hypothetical protein [bacterium]